MGLTINFRELPVPFGTEVPGTLEDWLTFFREHMSLDGLELFNGLNFGSATPAPVDRDKPWFKVEVTGTPIGWLAWDGAAWVPIPFNVPNGTTEQRPLNPVVGQKFLDTTINVELTFERGKWRTSSGSPGDIKYVNTPTIETALTRNPGWIQDAASEGRFIGGAGEGNGLTARLINDEVGAEKVTLTSPNLPAHAHDITGLVQERISRNNLGVIVWNSGGGGEGPAEKSTASTGDAEPFSIMPPAIYRWCLVKE